MFDKLPERIANKIMPEPNTGCWLWDAALTRGGYGCVGISKHKPNAKGRSPVGRAHRVVYEILIGKIPDGLDLDHLCRVPSCVNPDHLEPVTRSVNLRRGIGPEKNKARLAASISCKNGHPWNKDNTSFYVDRDGYKIRVCKTCSRIKQRKYKNRIK